jgi:lysophospholipase L1-like esterase
MTVPNTYMEVQVIESSISFDVSCSQSFGVLLSEPVSEFNFTGVPTCGKTDINIMFRQGFGGGMTVTFPKTVRPPKGVDSTVERGSMRATEITMSTVDGGATWFMNKTASYDLTDPPVFTLPPLSDENATFNDEGDSEDGWSPVNGTVSSADSVIRYTKSGYGVSWARKAAARPAPNSDGIIYARVKATSSPTAISVLHFYDPATSRQAGIWIGSAQGNTVPSQGSVSLTGTPSNPSVRNSALLATGVDYQNAWLDIALQWDSTYGTLNCFFREADGRWKFKGRVFSDYVGGPDIYAQFTPETPAGAVMEIDYITVAHPNLMAFGDSVAAGAPLFDPNPSLGRTNDESTWMRHAPIYKNLRNNLIVNKGVGGNTSYQSLLRMPQINASGAKVVFLQGPTNDWAAGFTQDGSKANMQAIVNSAVAAGAAVVSLNQIYCPQTTYGNTPLPVRRDWAIASWSNLMAMTGVSAFVDVMYALKDDNNFMDPALSSSDGHPNVSGYKTMGELISK